MVVKLPVLLVDFVLPVDLDVEQKCNTGILVVEVGVQQQPGDATSEDQSSVVVEGVWSLPHADSRFPVYSNSIVPVLLQCLEVMEKKQPDP